MPRQPRLDIPGALHHIKEAEEKEIRQLRIRFSGKSITDIIKEECKKRQVSVKELRGGSRRNKVSQTRALIAYRSHRGAGLVYC